MIKKSLAVIFAVLTAANAVMILYWKDSHFDPTAYDMVVYLLCLPLAVAFLILLPWFAYRFYETRKEKAKEQALLENEPQEKEVVKETPIEWQKFHIYTAHAYSSLGTDQDIVKAEQAKGAELDSKLIDTNGSPMLSARIQELDTLVPPSTEDGMENQQRILVLIQKQLDAQHKFLEVVSTHLRDSSLFYETQHIQEYRMHPAWIDPNVEYTDEEEQPTAKEVYRLDRVNFYFFFPEHLLHSWNNVEFKKLLDERCTDLGILPQKFHFECYFGNQLSSYEHWLNVLKLAQKKAHEVSFGFMATSEVDQIVLDEKLIGSGNYVPSEYASSCCITHEDVQINNVEPTKALKLATKREKIIDVLTALNLQDAEQFKAEEATPCVVISENATTNVNKRLERYFKGTKIQPDHHLFILPALGHTKALAQIYGFMLGMQFAEDQIAIVVNQYHYPHHIVIHPLEQPEEQDETDSAQQV